MSERNAKNCEHIAGLSEDVKTFRKALELMAKDYCDNMGCSFCQHHTKCLEANHFEYLEGKDYLQLLYIAKAREGGNKI